MELFPINRLGFALVFLQSIILNNKLIIYDNHLQHDVVTSLKQERARENVHAI
jgi:hypothetical protein